MKLNFKNVAAIIIAIGFTIFIAVYFTNSRHINGKDTYLDEPSTASDSVSAAGTQLPDSSVAAASSEVVQGPVKLEDILNRKTQAGINSPLIDPNREYTEEWAEKKIEEHKDEIAQKDLDDFENIVEELGSEKIKEDFKDGLSVEEQNELYNEMKDTLTDEEYERAKTLFEKYNWILSEE